MIARRAHEGFCEHVVVGWCGTSQAATEAVTKTAERGGRYALCVDPSDRAVGFAGPDPFPVSIAKVPYAGVWCRPLRGYHRHSEQAAGQRKKSAREHRIGRLWVVCGKCGLDQLSRRL